MRISYGRVRGSGYNARTGNNVSIWPWGAKRPNSQKKKKKKNSLRDHMYTQAWAVNFRYGMLKFKIS